MSNIKICVYAICLNEQKYVKNWLASMSEADYIVVLDTGSSDSTFSILQDEARRNPKLIVRQEKIHPWRFDTARNKSLSLVPKDTDVYLCIDLDELLDPGWSIPIRERWIPGVHNEGIYKYIWSHDASGNPARIFHYNKMHGPGWRWDYPVHETLIRPDSIKDKTDDTLYLFNDITLHHWPSPRPTRNSYLGLLKVRKAENPEDLFGLIYLAHEYYYKGMYKESIEELEGVLDKMEEQGENDSVLKASCYLFKGDAYIGMGDTERAFSEYNIGIDADPTYRECYLGAARTLIEKKNNTKDDLEMAYDILKECMKNTYRHYTWLERDSSWKEEMYDLLCLAAFYTGRKLESLYYAVKASKMNLSDERLKTNIDQVIECISDDDVMY